MNGYAKFKTKMKDRIERLEETIQELERHGLAEGPAATRWRTHLDQSRSAFDDPLLRIAVVGSVKSGKSTLINSLLRKDLLKRGAGIITAFITRIRTDDGNDAGGWIELKPWPQIMEELNTAVRLLPIVDDISGGAALLDIRKTEDRETLKARLDTIRTVWQQARAQVDPAFLLLSGFLDGYGSLQSNLGDTVNRLILDQQTILQHRHYVGHEGQATYVRDMELQCPVPWLGNRVEIADCQGSDSPNPVHFGLLQQYLLGAHFVLYVINSRTGLREADFKLLDFIKTVRLFPHTLFILNTDLDSHPYPEDLDRLAARVKNELGWVVPHPQLFAFSALYHLCEGLESDLSERERRRVELWRSERGLVERTEAGWRAFRDHMARHIAGQRVRVLVGSGLSRLTLVAGSIFDTACAQKRFMDQNLVSLKTSSRELRGKQKAFQDILSTLENAISGLRASLQREMDETVARTFHLNEGPLVREIFAMIDHYPIDSKYQETLADYRQLFRLLHLFYLEFRQSLSRYLVERVNMRVIEFAKEQEDYLMERLAKSSRAFWSLFTAALDDYRKDMAQLQIEVRMAVDNQDCGWDLPTSIPPPRFSAFLEQEAVGRGILLMKFGIGRFTRFLTTFKARVGKSQPFPESDSPDEESIMEAMSLVKAEAKSEIACAFRDYRRSFLRDYLHRILEEGTRKLMEEFRARAQMAQLDITNLMKQSEVEGEDRESVLEVLNRVCSLSQALLEEMENLGCAVNLEWMSEQDSDAGDGSNE